MILITFVCVYVCICVFMCVYVSVCSECRKLEAKKTLEVVTRHCSQIRNKKEEKRSR